MPKRYFLLVAFLICVLICEAQITYQKLITSSNKKIFENSMCAVSNDTFAITGKVTDYNDNLLKLYVLLLNENGDTLWTKVLKDSIDIYGESIIYSGDHTLAVTGRKGGDIIFLKLDLEGNILITETITPPADFFLYQSKIINAVDSGYLVHGQIVNDHGYGNQFIFKLNDSGNLEWAKTYYDTGNSIWKLIPCDSGYIWYGANDMPILVRMDEAGNISWSRKYDFMAGPALGYDVVHIDNGDFIMSGLIEQNPNWDEGILLQVDSSGNLKWAKGYGHPYNSMRAYNIIPQENKGHLCIGYIDVVAPFTTSTATIDSAGNISWIKAYRTQYPNYQASGIKAFQTSEKDIMISTTGSNWDLGFLQLSLYLIRTDSLGNSGCFDTIATINSRDLFPIQDTMMFADSSILLQTQPINFITDSSFTINNFCFAINADELKSTKHFKVIVSPNPFHTTARIEINNSNIQNCEIRIFNTMGVLVRIEKGIDLDSYVLSRGSLPDGLYFYELSSLNYELIGSGKFIVE